VAVAHRALTPDSELVAAGLGVLIVSVDSVDESHSKWVRPVVATLRGKQGNVPLRQVGTSEIIVADGLRPGNYELTVGAIGYDMRSVHVSVRAGYVDTVAAPLAEKLLAFCDPIFPRGGIFGGSIQFH
jgi:hypothetical protein